MKKNNNPNYYSLVIIICLFFCFSCKKKVSNDPNKETNHNRITSFSIQNFNSNNYLFSSLINDSTTIDVFLNKYENKDSIVLNLIKRASSPFDKSNSLFFLEDFGWENIDTSNSNKLDIIFPNNGAQYWIIPLNYTSQNNIINVATIIKSHLEYTCTCCTPTGGGESGNVPNGYCTKHTMVNDKHQVSVECIQHMNCDHCGLDPVVVKGSNIPNINVLGEVLIIKSSKLYVQ